MGTLQVQQISLSYGDRDLLHAVSLTISAGRRAALVGGNGSGKSTLLKIISGEILADGGTITTTKGMRVSYLPQSDIVHQGTNVFQEVEKAYDRFITLLESKRSVELQLAELSEHDNHTPLLEQLHEIQETLNASTYYRREANIEQVLVGLGFLRSDFTRRCEEFSGGWQMRIALAKVLVEAPDVMLLDEPTNYLDIEARIWLRNFLCQYPGAVIMVSHDQDFLDAVVSEVYELFLGELKRYSGNYSSYVVQREQELEQLQKAYKAQAKSIEQTERFIERFRYKASKAKQVQSREKQLEKEEIIQIPQHLKKLSFRFPEPPHSGNDVLHLDQLSKHYPSISLFSDFSLMVNKGDRLAITGRNGAGKTTLLRIIAGLDNHYSGTVKLGTGVKIGYFAQDTDSTLNGNLSILEEVSAVAATADIPRLRSLLGSFLFSDDDVDKKVSVLSGGERSRLALIKILLHPANLLILDEPTNHLDINAKQVLLEALKQYQGTVLFVSHDTHFIKSIANRILYLSEQEPELFEGDYEYFSWKLEQKEALEQAEETRNRQPAQTDSIEESSLAYKELNRAKNRLRNCVKESEQVLHLIDNKEQEVKQVMEAMAKKENYSDSNRITSLLAQKSDLEAEHALLEERWFAIHEEISSLEEYLGQ
jgi:ATP-binding cassette subfamily F protein 3